jgi:hypothetical protein
MLQTMTQSSVDFDVLTWRQDLQKWEELHITDREKSCFTGAKLK